MQYVSFFRITAIVVLMAATGMVSAQTMDTAFRPYEQTIPGTTVVFKMVPVKGGAFRMGSEKNEKGRKPDEGPARQVNVSSFWLGTHEVTYDEYDAFFKDEEFSQNESMDAITRPSPPYIDLTLNMGKEGGFPANSMSQYGTIMYCRWLYKKTGIFFRIPTEAEWEFACRAGSTAAYPFGNDVTQLGNYAWYKDNSDNKYHKTGLKTPNAWGLYDMIGNVAEWTLDQYDENYYKNIGSEPKDPLILPTARHPRTLKGGTYQDEAGGLRNASRLMSNPDWNRRDPQIPRSRWWNADAPFIGFRVLRPLKQPSAEETEQFFSRYLK
ncbi:MAG: SUMF1/EgtB/PvdO family nonheme iron enzyme [Chitinophagaceae bacterium]